MWKYLIFDSFPKVFFCRWGWLLGSKTMKCHWKLRFEILITRLLPQKKRRSKDQPNRRIRSLQATLRNERCTFTFKVDLLRMVLHYSRRWKWSAKVQMGENFSSYAYCIIWKFTSRITTWGRKIGFHRATTTRRSRSWLRRFFNWKDFIWEKNCTLG